MRTVFFLSPLFMLLLQLPGFTQERAANMNKLMQQYHAFNMFDGAVLAAQNGKIIYKAAFGKANREWNIANTIDTKFMIGSVSKPLTAVLVLVQVQKGLITLDEKISHYLPEFVNKPAAAVTVRQMLAHTSGIPNYDITKDFFPRISRQQFDRSNYLKTFIDSALAFEPGSRYNYSSWAYFTLGYLVEKVTGKTYAQAMKEDVLDKAGMQNTGSYYHTQVVEKRATGYDYTLGAYSSADFRDQSNTMGTGDLYSTVEDLFKFHLAIENNSLLNKDLTKQMLAPGINPANYGLGWFNKYYKWSATDSAFSNFHLGMTDGFISFFRRMPGSNDLVVILCNSSPTDFFGITNNLYKIMYGQPVSLKKPLHKIVENAIAKEGAEKAVSIFNSYTNDTAHYYTDWISMNFIAEQLLILKRYGEARIIAANNIIAFGDKDRVNVTMGNIYLETGKKPEAISFYKKALLINPGYEEAKNRLKELE